MIDRPPTMLCCDFAPEQIYLNNMAYCQEKLLWINTMYMSTWCADLSCCKMSLSESADSTFACVINISCDADIRCLNYQLHRFILNVCLLVIYYENYNLWIRN